MTREELRLLAARLVAWQCAGHKGCAACPLAAPHANSRTPTNPIILFSFIIRLTKFYFDPII